MAGTVTERSKAASKTAQLALEKSSESIRTVNATKEKIDAIAKGFEEAWPKAINEFLKKSTAESIEQINLAAAEAIAKIEAASAPKA